MDVGVMQCKFFGLQICGLQKLGVGFLKNSLKKDFLSYDSQRSGY